MFLRPWTCAKSLVFNVNRLGIVMNQSSPCFHFCHISNEFALERWKVIDGSSNYQVSSLGNVKNTKRNKLLKIDIRRFLVIVYLTYDGKQRMRYAVGRLVLDTFEPRDTADKLFAIHIDGNKYNNALSNLKWSIKFHKYVHATSKTSNARLKLRVIASGEHICFDSIRQCQEYLLSALNVTSPTISNWCYGKKIMHGYQFEFVNEEKYSRNVRDLDGELWKLYYETPKKKNQTLHFIIWKI
eukprot:287786_1